MTVGCFPRDSCSFSSWTLWPWRSSESSLCHTLLRQCIWNSMVVPQRIHVTRVTDLSLLWEHWNSCWRWQIVLVGRKSRGTYQNSWLLHRPSPQFFCPYWPSTNFVCFDSRFFKKNLAKVIANLFLNDHIFQVSILLLYFVFILAVNTKIDFPPWRQPQMTPPQVRQNLLLDQQLQWPRHRPLCLRTITAFFSCICYRISIGISCKTPTLQEETRLYPW